MGTTRTAGCGAGMPACARPAAQISFSDKTGSAVAARGAGPSPPAARLAAMPLLLSSWSWRRAPAPAVSSSWRGRALFKSAGVPSPSLASAMGPASVPARPAPRASPLGARVSVGGAAAPRGLYSARARAVSRWPRTETSGTVAAPPCRRHTRWRPI
eukprot:5834768-Pleurochrysis_carterae.AAC.1